MGENDQIPPVTGDLVFENLIIKISVNRIMTEILQQGYTV